MEMGIKRGGYRLVESTTEIAGKVGKGGMRRQAEGFVAEGYS